MHQGYFIENQRVILMLSKYILIFNRFFFKNTWGSNTLQRTGWKSYFTWPSIPWSVNSYTSNLQFLVVLTLNDIYCIILALTKKPRLNLRPYNSDFLLTTTSFIPSLIMLNEMGVSSHKEKYSGHLKLFPLHITWQLAVLIFGAIRVHF